MSLLKQQELQAVSDAITDAERNTDAELVAVLAAQSDDYRYIPTLWAAVIALLVPGVVWFAGLWLETLEVLAIQLGCFFVLTVLFRVPAIMLHLIPRSVRNWRASNLARRQFLDNNLHHTEQECGVMIFVSEAEHYVEILADRGIDQHVDQQQWQAIVDTLIAAIKKGQTQQGLIRSIESCGELLAQHAPATKVKNELPNHLVLL